MNKSILLAGVACLFATNAFSQVTAGTGIDVNGTTVSVKLANNSGLEAAGSGLSVKTGSTLQVTSGALGIKYSSSFTEDANGLKINNAGVKLGMIDNGAVTFDNLANSAVATSITGATNKIATDNAVKTYVDGKLDGALSAINAQVAQNTSDIADHETMLSAINTRVAQNTSDIADHETMLSAINTQVAQNTSDIADVVNNITVAYDGKFITAGADVASNLSALDTALYTAVQTANAAYAQGHEWAEGLLGVDVDSNVNTQLQTALNGMEGNNNISATTIAGALHELDVEKAGLALDNTFTGDNTFEGKTTFGATDGSQVIITNDGNMTVDNNLGVGGKLTVDNGAEITGNTTIKGALYAGANGTEFQVGSTGNVYADGNIQGKSFSNTDGSFQVGSTGNVYVGTDKFTVEAASGNVEIGGTLDVTGALNGSTATFTGLVTSEGLDAGSGDITTTGAIGGGTLDISGDAGIGGDLTVTGALNGSTATFTGLVTSEGLDAGSGDITTTGAIGGGTLDISGDAGIGGDLTVTGALNGSTATFTGLVTSEGLDAGSGDITTTGAIKGGSLTVDGGISAAGTKFEVYGNGYVKAANGKFTVTEHGYMTAANGKFSVNQGGSFSAADGKFSVDQNGNVETKGTLNINGATLTGSEEALTSDKKIVSANGFEVDENNSLTAAGLKISAADITGDATIAGTLTADGESKFAKDAEGIYALDVTTEAINANKVIDANEGVKFGEDETAMTSVVREAIASKPAVGNDSAIASATAVQATRAAIESDNAAVLGGIYKIDEDEKTVSYDATALVGNGFEAETENLSDALNKYAENVAAAMGTAFAEDGSYTNTFTRPEAVDYDGLESQSFVSAIAQLDKNIGDAVTVDYNGVSDENTVNANIDALNSIIGDVSTLDGNALNMGTDEQPETVVQALQNINDTLGVIHSLVESEDATQTTTGVDYYGNLAVGTTVEQHLEALDASIGDRRGLESLNEEINEATKESLARGLEAAGNAIGDADFSQTNYASSLTDASSAIRALDSNLYRLDNEVKDLRKDVNRGFASMAAMSAMVPNARAKGNTQLSFGTGMYSGHTGFALGGFHWFTDNLLMNIGVAYGRGNSSDVIYRAGVTYSW